MSVNGRKDKARGKEGWDELSYVRLGSGYQYEGDGGKLGMKSDEDKCLVSRGYDLQQGS